MEHDLQGLRVGGDHDELGDVAVQRFGGLVCAFLDLMCYFQESYLLQRGCLSEKIKDLLLQFGVRKRSRSG